MKVIQYTEGTAESICSASTPEEILADVLGEPYLAYRKRWNDAKQFKFRPSFPIHLDIELSYRCNLRCIMCPFGEPDFKHPPYKGQKLKIEVVKKIIREGVQQGLSSVRFNILNEPLLEKSLSDLIRYVKEAGIIDTFITTNGMLLSEQKSYELIQSGLTHIMVSLDAATPETYSILRIGGDYEKVVKNIENFIKVRNELGARLPLLRLSFTKVKPNAHETDKFTEMWIDKVDYIAVAGYVNMLGDSDTNKELAREAGTMNGVKNYACWQPWARCSIFANGDVFPCCLPYGRAAPVGNIYESDLSSIWQSDTVKHIQDINKTGEYFKYPTCKKCISNRDIFE